MAQVNKFGLLEMLRAKGFRESCLEIRDMIEKGLIGFEEDETTKNSIAPGVIHEAFSDYYRLGSILEYDPLSRLGEDTAANVTGQFRTIITQLTSRTMIKAYNMSDTVWRQLVSVDSTTQPTKVTVAGFTAPEYPEVVLENAEYPRAHFRDKSVSVTLAKYGRILGLTKELLIAERSNDIVKAARQIGEAAANFQDKIVVDVVQNANSTSYNGGTLYDNSLYANTPSSPAAITHDLLQDAYEGLWAMTADNTDAVNTSDSTQNTYEPIPIRVMPNVLLVGYKAYVPAYDILKADRKSGTAENDPNVFKDLRPQLIMSQHLDTANSGTNAGEEWFLGDFKKQFTYFESWPLQVTSSRTDSEFYRDVPFEIKVSLKGGAGALDYRYVWRGY